MGIFRRSEPAKPAQAAILAPAAAVSKGLFRRLPRRVRLLVGLSAALSGFAAAGIAGMMVYYTVTFPDPLTLRQKERAPVVRILARDGTTLTQRGGAHDYMPLDLLPKMVIDAVVATEDRRFNEHWGMDPAGLIRASFANMRAGRFAQGGSTLTQQLAKNLFLTPERTMARKMEEMLLAFWLELRLSKGEILELYLNHVYFGGGAYGIEAASQRFFDKSARELTIAEAAVIAGLLKAPSKYSPTANPGAARARGRVVLSKMRDAGVITADQEKRARAEVVQFAGPKQTSEQLGHDYAVDYVLDRLPSLIGQGHAEIIVETTIDADLQRRATEIARKELVLQGSVLSANQAAVVVTDTDGAIRALVGGRSYADSQFNRATRARRQPGSTFKPFVYLAALEAGMTPDSPAYDLPFSIKGWSPHNENGKYAGQVTLRQALAQSINTVAARLTADLGPRRVSAVAQRLGIKSELREEPSLALGTSEVSLLELVSAYGAFANGGRAVAPHVIRRVRMGNGRVIYARTAPEATQAVEPRHVGAMNDMLNEAMIRGTGRRAAIPAHAAAGKTGTSQDFRDAWFIGYTAHLVAGVWVGNDNGATMNKVRGGQLPADIWRQVMLTAHTGKPALMLPGTTRKQPPVTPAAPAVAASPAPVQAVAGAAAPAGVAGPEGPRLPPSPAPTAASELEVLPWLVAKPALPAPTETGAVPIFTHPRESIDPELLARAIDGSADLDPRRRAAAAPARSTAGRKIIVRPPPGLMSLGAGLGADGDGPLEGDGEDEIEQAVAPQECSAWAWLTGC